GEYEVVFNDLSGWTTPATETVTVQEASPAPAPASATDGNDASVTGTYTLILGSLEVNVATSPNYDPLNSSATWTLSQTSTVSGITFSTISRSGSKTINDVPLGDYEVVFDDAAGWITPGNKSLTLSSATTESTTGTYALQVGTLNINVESSPNYDPLNSSATWTLNQTASTSGFPFSTISGTGSQSFSDVPYGTYEVVFDDATGWETPGAQTLLLPAVQDRANSVNPTVTSDEASATGTYVLKVGTLTVNIASDPDWDDTNDNAGWTVTAQSTVSGISFTPVSGTGTQTINDVPLGIFDIDYADRTGWVTPASDTVTVEETSPAPAESSDGNDASVTGTYTLEMIDLTVTITTSHSPSSIPGSAPWSVSGTTTGGPSFSTSGTGSGVETIPTGDYTISYGDFTNWDTPADEPIAVNIAREVVGLYVRHLGSVEVFITPDAAIAGGAGWRTNPNEGWRDSGTTASGIPTGIVYVEFNDATDYFTPSSVQVIITDGTTQTVIVSYSDDLTGTGNLQINIDGVNGNGNGSAPANIQTLPQWRFAGENTWYDSGVIIANIANGNYDIEFSVVEGHLPPSQTSVTVRPGIDNDVAAEYLRPLIVHKSDYDGDGAEDL
ncbi:MAG: hypothetical protein MI702_02225, partial [Chlorobiales bacterium]|nr:hypothetical protein [Chlorobiales bacterium]